MTYDANFHCRRPSNKLSLRIGPELDPIAERWEASYVPIFSPGTKSFGSKAIAASRAWCSPTGVSADPKKATRRYQDRRVGRFSSTCQCDSLRLLAHLLLSRRSVGQRVEPTCDGVHIPAKLIKVALKTIYVECTARRIRPIQCRSCSLI